MKRAFVGRSFVTVRLSFVNDMNNKMTVGVVGAGTMGRGIAQVAAAAGHEVRLLDRSAAVPQHRPHATVGSASVPC